MGVINKKLTNEQFIERAINIHNNRYDYSLINYKNKSTKVEIKCNKCNFLFKQTPDNHIHNKQGCPKCYGNNKLTKEDFLFRAIQIHGNRYDYSKFEVINNMTKSIIICRIHGEFSQRPRNHIVSKQGCPICKISKGEEKIRLFLEQNNIKFEQQKTFKNCRNKRELPFDFYLQEQNILIEYDGKQHFGIGWMEKHKDEFSLLIQRDNIKTKFAKSQNIKLLRINYNQYNEIDQILNTII